MQESCTQGTELAPGGEGAGVWQVGELVGGGWQAGEPSKPFDIRQGATEFGVCPDFFCLA